MRTAILVAMGSLVLSGCGIAARQERAEQIADVRAQANAGWEACKARFPESSRDYVAKTKCDADAAAVLRAYSNYPDLFDRYWAYRAVVAERLQGGKLTLAEARAQVAENESKIAAEEQQRNLANRSVAAQEKTARAAVISTLPVSCSRTGNTTTCF